jgi:2-dehydropantoate 2-reductase
MDIAIYGAGAIGLDMGVHLIEAGHRVSLIARGSTLSTLNQLGIEHWDLNGRCRVLPKESFDCFSADEELLPQDIVFLTVKADALFDISENIARLLKGDTLVVSTTNGIPPWYSFLQNNTIGRHLRFTQGRNIFLDRIPGKQIIGAVIERSVNRRGPNQVVHSFGKGYCIGELDHTRTERLESLLALLNQAKLESRVSDDIHRDIYLKLIGNICVNPLSVLAEKNIGGLLSNPEIRKEMAEIAFEAEAVGLAIGVIKIGDFAFDRFISFMEINLAHHEPSMLQDFRCGKPLELRRILEVVIMLAGLKSVGVDVPHLQSLQERLASKTRSHPILVGSHSWANAI